jgi:hypothetical protein
MTLRKIAELMAEKLLALGDDHRGVCSRLWTGVRGYRKEGFTAMTPKKWYVHIWVRGYYSGSYEHRDRETAMSDMKERRASMGPRGCHYEISTKPTEPR